MPAASPTSAPSFEAVIERHGPTVLRFCIARAGPDRGEDCFQETMLAALRGYDRVRDPDAVRGWLLSIAARATIDNHRRRSRAPIPVDDLEPLLAGVEDAPRDEALWELVRTLPAKQREAVTLRYLGDLTNAEIAAVMQTSPEAARRNVFEGLRRLRARLNAA